MTAPLWAGMDDHDLLIHYNMLEDQLRTESVLSFSQSRHDEIDAIRRELVERGVV